MSEPTDCGGDCGTCDRCLDGMREQPEPDDYDYPMRHHVQSIDMILSNFPRDKDAVRDAIKYMEGGVSDFSDNEKRVALLLASMRRNLDYHWFARYIPSTCDILYKLATTGESQALIKKSPGQQTR